MPATEPTQTIEIEFTAGVWTDVSAYFRAANIKRGKQRAIDNTTVGTETITLSNQGRVFDPEYSGSPYYGNLAPQKRIRHRATWNAVTYDVFTGYIDRIIQSYTSPRDAVAIIECSDGLSKLASSKLPSPWEIETKKLAPWTWLRLGERTGPTAFDSSGNNHHGLYVGNPTHSAPSLVGGTTQGLSDGDHATLFPSGVGDNYVLGGKNTLPTTSSWTIAFLLKLSAVPTSTQFLLFDSVYPRGLSIYISSAGVLTATVVKPDGTTGSTVSMSIGLIATPESKYPLTIVAAAGSTPKIYLGNDDFFTSGAAGTTHTILTSDIVLGLSPLAGMTIDEFTVWDRALSLAEIEARVHGNAFYSEDTATERVTHILDAMNWPVADRSITTQSDGTLIGTPLQTDALSHLEEIRTTIEGRLWVKTNGVLTLLGRNEHLVSPYSISQGTFGDTGGQLHYTQMGVYALDYLTIANVVNRRNVGPFIPDGSTITATDTTSIASYGARSVDIDSLYNLVAPEDDLAHYHLAHFANPLPYIEGLEVIPRNDPTNLWPQVLGRDLGDRITFERTPQGIGTPISVETIIEGVTHDIAPKRWKTHFMIDATYAQRYFLFDDTVWDDSDWRFAA